MNDRVGELSIRIRSDGGGDHEALRRAGTEFARAVLDRLVAVIEDRAPGRVVMLRTLPLRWRLLEDGLTSDREVEEFARSLAEGIEAQLPATVERPAADAEAVVFEDTAHLYADRLRARVAGEAPWFHAGVDPFDELGAPDQRELAAATLARLADRGELVAVLAASPAPVVARWADALGSDHAAPPDALDATDAPAATSTELATPAAIDRIAALVPGWQALPVTSRAVALHAAAKVVLGNAAPPATVRALARRVVQRIAPRPSHTASPAPSPPPAEPGTATSSVAASPPAEAPLDGAALEPDAGLVSTLFGGLFYLLRLALELDAGQILWIACLPEGDLLAAAARAILGPAANDDPAPDLFGGVASHRALPEVAAEQQEEACQTLLAQMLEAFPRHDLASIPSVAAALVDSPSGRLLVVTPEGTGFPIFAWPATRPDALRAGLEQFLAMWPVGASIIAAPALAMLAPSRVRSEPRLQLPPPLVAHVGGSAPTLALITQLGGSLCALFAARARTTARTAEQLVAAHLSVPAIVRVTPEQMTAAISSRHLDLNLRVAGLDADPGWVGWLQRHVRLEYYDLEIV